MTLVCPWRRLRNVVVTILQITDIHRYAKQILSEPFVAIHFQTGVINYQARRGFVRVSSIPAAPCFVDFIQKGAQPE